MMSLKRKNQNSTTIQKTIDQAKTVNQTVDDNVIKPKVSRLEQKKVSNKLTD